MTILTLLALSFGPFSARFHPSALDFSEDDIHAQIHSWIVATINGEIVGCMLSERQCDHWTFSYLCVEHAFRRLGVARSLVNFAIQNAIHDGAKEIQIVLRRSMNDDRWFFERLGFVCTAPLETRDHDLYVLDLQGS